MGCRGSKKKKDEDHPCSVEQKTEMFQLAVKDMMLICAKQAIEKGSASIVIKLPDQDFSHLDQLIVEVQAIAPPATESTASTNNASPPPSENKGKKGMMDRGKAFLKDAKNKAENMTKKAGGIPLDPLTASLGKLAEDLLRVRNNLQAAFDQCGAELFRVPTPGSEGCRLGKVKIFNMFASCIQDVDLASANVFDLVRGKEPYGAPEYAHCESDRVTSLFVDSGSTTLVKQLVGTEGGIEEATAVKAWVELDKSFQALNSKVGKINAKMKKPAMKMIAPGELKLHIANQFVKQIGDSMAVEEARQRDLSKRSKVSWLGCSNVFNLHTCFNAVPELDGFMVNAHYNNRIGPVIDTE